MPATLSIEERLTALEKIVWDLQRQLALLRPGANALEVLPRGISDVAALDEVMEIIRASKEAELLAMDAEGNGALDQVPDKVSEIP